MKNKTMISCDKTIHRNLKVFCSIYEIKTLDQGIQELLKIAQT